MVESSEFFSRDLLSLRFSNMFSKLLVPETEKPVTLGVAKIDYKDPSANVLDSISNGTSTGLQLALNVAGMLIAFTALIALFSGIVEWFTGLFLAKALTIEQVFGYVFSPLAWILGVPSDEIIMAGTFSKTGEYSGTCTITYKWTNSSRLKDSS